MLHHSFMNSWVMFLLLPTCHCYKNWCSIFPDFSLVIFHSHSFPLFQKKMKNWEIGSINSLRLLYTPYWKLQMKFHPKVVVETRMSMYLFKGGSMLLCVLLEFLSVSFRLILAKTCHNCYQKEIKIPCLNLLLTVHNISAFYRFYECYLIM